MVQNYSSFSPITQDWNICSMDQFQSHHSDLKFSSSNFINQDINDYDQSNRMIDIFNTYTTLNKFDLPDSNNYPSYNYSTDTSNVAHMIGKIPDTCQLIWQTSKDFSPPNNKSIKSYYTDSSGFKHPETKFYSRCESFSSSPFKNNISQCHENENKILNYSSRPQQNMLMYQNTIKTRKNNHLHQSYCDNYNNQEVSSSDKLNLTTSKLWDSKKPMYLKILTTQVVSGTIIGKGGKGLNWFRRKSRIDDIHISMPWEVYPGTEFRTILLRGTIKSVVKAVTMTSDLMSHKSNSDFSQSSCISALIVFPDMLLPKIMELKSSLNSKYVSIIPYKEPEFNEIVLSLRGERQFLRNLISYFVHLVDQIIGITDYCFISYKSDRQNSINNDKNILKNDDTLQNRISFITGQQYDQPALTSSDKSETSNLNLTLNDLAPDDLTSSGAIDTCNSKFTPPGLKYNECRDLKNTKIFYSNNSGDGNDLFNTTCCISTSPLLDQGLPYVNEVSNYPVTLSFTLPSNLDLTTFLTNYPQFHDMDLPLDDKGLPICKFNGTFNDVFAKASAFISEMYDHTL